MKTMTIEDLFRMLIDCAGHGEDIDLNGDAFDRDLEDLGYDSLALIETAAAIEQEFSVRIPDDRLGHLRTPRSVLDQVNDRLNLAS